MADDHGCPRETEGPEPGHAYSRTSSLADLLLSLPQARAAPWFRYVDFVLLTKRYHVP
jgi:hypothetical protein